MFQEVQGALTSFWALCEEGVLPQIRIVVGTARLAQAIIIQAAIETTLPKERKDHFRWVRLNFGASALSQQISRDSYRRVLLQRNHMRFEDPSSILQGLNWRMFEALSRNS